MYYKGHLPFLVLYKQNSGIYNRLADQHQFIMQNEVFTAAELKELQRFTQDKETEALPRSSSAEEASQGEFIVEKASLHIDSFSFTNQEGNLFSVFSSGKKKPSS